VFTNHTVTLANDPADPADLPAAATITFANGARTVAAGSSVGGTADFFLDIAVPWATLTPLGLARDTPVHVWAASSSSANSLNGDFACHDGGTGAAHLDTTASDQTTGDPAMDPGTVAVVAFGSKAAAVVMPVVAVSPGCRLSPPSHWFAAQTPSLTIAKRVRTPTGCLRYSERQAARPLWVSGNRS